MKRINLIVDYCDKDIVKNLGAKWDSKIKKWYITYDEEELDLDALIQFYRWFDKDHLDKFFMKRINLNVENVDKDKIKKLGAKWDSKIKKWYLTYHDEEYDQEYLEKFYRWFGKDDLNKLLGNFNYYNYPLNQNSFIFFDLYLVETKKECWKCEKIISVFSLSSTNFIYNNEIYKVKKEKLFFSPDYIFNNNELIEFLNNVNYKKVYSNFLKRYYYGTKCNHCNSLQGNNNLYNEIDSPFGHDSKNYNLTFKRINIDKFQEINSSTLHILISEMQIMGL